MGAGLSCLLPRLPLILPLLGFAPILLLWKRQIRQKFCQKRHPGPAVFVNGRKAVFPDALLLCLGGPAASPSAGRSHLRLAWPEGPTGPIVVGEGDEVPFSFTYLMARERWRRELLYAWSWACQVTAAAFRGLDLPPMRVAAVVLPWMPDREALLLTRRAPRGGAYNSMWVFPGGGLDSGERAEAAAAREVQEETGLEMQASSLRFLCAYQARNEVLCLTYLMLIYSCETKAGGTLQLQAKEVAQAAFLTKPVIESLLSRRPAGNVEGRAFGKGGELVEQPVPLSSLDMTRDGIYTGSNGIGAGHWFALEEWWSTHGRSQ